MSSNNTRVFGQATRGGRGRGRGRGGGGATRYQRQTGNSGPNAGAGSAPSEEQERAARRLAMKLKRRAEDEALDERFGFRRYDCATLKEELEQEKASKSGSASDSGDTDIGSKKRKGSRRGWIFNLLPTTITIGNTNSGVATSKAIEPTAGESSNSSPTGGGGPERAGLDCYFLTSEGTTFKSTIIYDPYFYIIATPPSRHRHGNSSSTDMDDAQSNFFSTLISQLLRKYEASGLKSATLVRKHDLDALNHLGEVGSKGRQMIKLSFDTTQQLMDVRREIQPLILENKKREEEAELNPTFRLSNASTTYGRGSGGNGTSEVDDVSRMDPLTAMIDMREYDVPYTVRVCIDLNIRAGAWYTITPNPHECAGKGCLLSEQDVETKADPSFLAFDIECTKAPLKFPDANVDSIYMISYMVNTKGYLILSRSVVSQDVQDFEYTPKPNYPGPFHIYNEANEEDLIRRFCAEFQKHGPQIVVTYNGDFFDWPFLEQRCAVYGLDMKYELGIERVGGSNSDGSGSNQDGEYRGRCCVHMDAFSWVRRDSYLPQGSQGLKAVTKYKLGYDPVEVDPEDMVRYAIERPVHMASYSVSDAVATYYLYEKYVHMFIFSLCTIIPMGPEDVLRKGSGTLCEVLLMVQACEKDIICPNKEKEPLAKFHDGHLLESETYIGGKVECLETGVYRSDIEYKFDLVPSAFQGLIDNVDRDLTFALEVEGGIDRSTVTNYDEIRCQIIEQLEQLRDRPKRIEKPYIYHLDVGAMYPNIILTNRLQPNAMVNDSTCAACDFNQIKNDCKRKMEWVWRGDYTPATKGEYDRAKDQLSREKIEGMNFYEYTEAEQAAHVAQRLKQYAKNAYRRTKITQEVTKVDTVCMRENDFYVNTVRDFRDKRYVLKKLTKVWGKKVKDAKDPMSKKEAEDKALVYDSLQVAHKCILNSFYGYVMRKGARWRSMEMAGIVTKNGADLITQARILVEQIGRPLELDTDGIWCILPKSFPDNYMFKTITGGKFKLEYPCIMLNADVHANFTNHQYQTLKDPKKRLYETRSECSIFFEVDGPYRAMILPASTEEGKLLKKRYAVFNFDGSLAELKGFELKRRGELELVKTFQLQVFERFLNGNSLKDCYASVADIANHWLDVLDTQGASLETDELVDLISENRNMSRQLEDYGKQKGTSQTTARRLGEFLGAEIIKDKGLNCKFIIAERPHGAPVTERAIPTAIWKSETAVMKHYLRKWLKSPGMEDEDFEIQNILDWEYYRERLGKSIQKIITIPAALQNIKNPVPRLPHPLWLQRTVRRLSDRHKQKSITSMFKPLSESAAKTSSKIGSAGVQDIEDMMGGNETPGAGRPVVHVNRRTQTNRANERGSNGLNGTDEQEIVQLEKEEPKKTFLSKETFSEWLKYSKGKSLWNFKERRKRARLEQRGSTFLTGRSKTVDEGISKKQRKGVGSMAGYIRDAAQSLADSEWHLLEIRDNSSSDSGPTSTSSGELILWVMLGNGSLQKLNVIAPRVIHVSCTYEAKETSTKILSVKRVEKYLPHNKSSAFLYEVTMPEHVYRSQSWMAHFRSDIYGEIIESFYEMGTSQILRSLVQVGSICRLSQSAVGKGGKYSIADLKLVEKPKEGGYLNENLSYRKIFIFEKLHARSKTGLLAVFVMETSNKKSDENPDNMIDMTSSCHFWAVRPSGNKGQRSISKKMCEAMFSEMLQVINQEVDDDPESDYSALAPSSNCEVSSLSYVSSEELAFKGAQEVLNTYSQANNGPTFLLVNSGKSISQLRKGMPSFNSYPVAALPMPPGPQFGTHSASTPSLNWEKESIEFCFNAYLYMGVVSLPKYVDYARYAKVPLGNLGTDAIITTYDVMFARILQKNRTLLWASGKAGCPDTGLSSLSIMPGSTVMGLIDDNSNGLDSNDIWGEENENISPVVAYPGAYRSICAEIDIHNLAIAALSEANTSFTGSMGRASGDVAMGHSSAPLGDEMSTALSLPLLRVLVQSWLHDATAQGIKSADQLLSHLYRLVCSPEALLNDSALHRVLVSLMKTTFNKLLGEFQRMGSTIISATFNRVVISTNKSTLGEAMEHVDFVMATIKARMAANNESADFARLSLQKNRFYAHYIFLDEHNHGGLLFESREAEDDDEAQWALTVDVTNEESASQAVTVIPTTESGWNMMHYLASDISQEYFRAVISRFSKDVYRKQLRIEEKRQRHETIIPDPQSMEDQDDAEDSQLSPREQLLQYKKKLISKHFASYLTQAVGEILKDDGGPESFPELPGSHLSLSSPALEFIKSVVTVLELDSDVDTEVQHLKKSLLYQIGVQEYSNQASWQNPCASFILPDVFCSECQECRDIDLCILPPLEEDQTAAWTCDDCGTPYNADCIERRLVDAIQRKCIRYQLQDLRCTKTGFVSKRLLSRQSDTSQKLKLDVSRKELSAQLRILNNLAHFYDLEWLLETSQSLLQRI